MLDFYRGKRVFVTGHTGFKGAWLCMILALAGAEVTGFALPPEEGPNLYTIADIEKCVDSRFGDIRDLSALQTAFDAAKPEVVFHLAAQPIVREGYRDPVGTYATNVMGTVHLLDCVRRSGSVRSVVNVTTDKVYENREADRPFRESDRLNGRDPYGTLLYIDENGNPHFDEDGTCQRNFETLESVNAGVRHFISELSEFHDYLPATAFEEKNNESPNRTRLSEGPQRIACMLAH